MFQKSILQWKKRTIYNAVLLHAYTSWKSSKIPHEKQYKLQIIVLVQQKTDAVSWCFFLQEVQVVYLVFCIIIRSIYLKVCHNWLFFFSNNISIRFDLGGKVQVSVKLRTADPSPPLWTLPHPLLPVLGDRLGCKLNRCIAYKILQICILEIKSSTASQYQ